MGVHEEVYDDNIRLNIGATRKVRGSKIRKDKNAPKKELIRMIGQFQKKYEVNKRTLSKEPKHKRVFQQIFE